MYFIGDTLHPTSFVNRFRVVARKVIYFQERVSKLGPAYLDCNERQSSCTRRKADPRKGCPTCEFTIQHKIFVEETEKELRVLKGTTREGARKWPLKRLLEIVYEVAHMSNRYKDTNDPKWPVALSNMISVYRNEYSKLKAIRDFALSQQIDATRNKGKRTKGTDDGE